MNVIATQLTRRLAPLQVKRASVWHAGYEDSKEADEIVAQIEALQKAPAGGIFGAANRQSSSSSVLSAKLRKLQAEYETVAGEPYEDAEVLDEASTSDESSSSSEATK